MAQSCLWMQMSFWTGENLEWRGKCEPGARFSAGQEHQLGDDRLWETLGSHSACMDLRGTVFIPRTLRTNDLEAT